MADSDPQDLRHTIVQNVPPAMVLAILAVLARFESRRLKRGGIAWHDIFIVLGLLGSLLQSALVIVGKSHPPSALETSQVQRPRKGLVYISGKCPMPTFV